MVYDTGLALPGIHPPFVFFYSDILWRRFRHLRLFRGGVVSSPDPQWVTAYSDIYKFTFLPRFYVVAGNHDHRGNVLAKIDYSAFDPTWLMPALSGGERIDFLAGHDHNLEIRQSVDGVNYVISGAGGKLRDITAEPESLYAASVPGAVIIEIDAAGFKLIARDSQTAADTYSMAQGWN